MRSYSDGYDKNIYDTSLDVHMPEQAFEANQYNYEETLLEIVKRLKISKYPTEASSCSNCAEYMAPAVFKFVIMIAVIWCSVLGLKLVRRTLRTSTTKALTITMAFIFIVAGKL